MKFNYLVLFLVIFTISGKLSQAQVTADFSVNKSFGCSPLTDVQFTDKSTPSDGSLTYSWDLGNGNTSTLQNPGATYSNPSGSVGTKYYTVKLTVTKGGQSSSKTMIIKVFNNPVANFSTTDNVTKACVPFTAQFHNLSTADTTMRSWLWQYGNGAFDTLSQKNFTYNFEGKYNVSLIVTDNHGCFNAVSKTNYIDVASPPDVQFHADPAFTCKVPAVVNFLNDSRVKGTPSYQWISGSSVSILKDASFTFSKYDTAYTVKLTVTDNTYNTINNCVSINQLEYKIDRIKAVGTVKQGTKVINSTGSIVCAGTVNLESHSLPRKGLVLWTIDNNVYSTYDSIAQYDFDQAGNHTITLVSTPGSYCADTLKWSFYVEKVVPQFTQSPAKTCQQSALVSFTNTSSVNAASFVWKFNDGTTSTSKNPSPITYSVPSDNSVYDVHEVVQFPTKLIAITINNCKDSVVHPFIIKRPTAIFSVDTVSGCAPLLVNFSDHSQSDTAIASRDWDMGNGTILNKTIETTAAYTFTLPGVYNTKLNIANKSGCGATSYTIPIRVGVQPNAGFSVSPSPVCQSGVVSITDLTPVADKADYYLYTINGVSIAACPDVKSPTFRSKPDIGTLTIKQKVGYNGCYKEATQTITNNGPIASFTDTIPDCSNPYAYQFVGSYKGTGSATFKWDFDDATTSTSLSPLHTFPTSPQDKNYTVKFIVFDNACSDTAIQIVRVRKNITGFTAPAWACALQPVSFVASASQPLSELCGEKYTWNFDDTTSVVRTDTDPIKHVFKYSANYKVKLSAIHDNGCIDTVSHRIRIYRPKARLNTDKTGGCPGTKIKFTDASIPDVNPITNLYMDFGDMTNSTSTTAGSSFNRIYMDQGVYDAYLRVTDNKGCYDSTKVTIGIEQPVVTLVPSEVPPQTCVNKTITFTETALEVDNMFWDFGDGTTSNLNQLSIDHVFTKEGQFNVKIRVSKYGCKDSTTLLVETQKADASFWVNDSVLNCPRLPFSMKHLYPSTNIVSGEWDLGDRTFPYDTTLHTIMYNYKTSGTYKAQLSITTSFGCKDFKTKTIKVLGPKATFNLSTKKSCRKVPVTFSMSDTLNIGKYEWDFGDGNVDKTGLHPVTSHKYFVGDTMYVFLNINNPSGACPVALADTIVVDSLTAKFSVVDTAGCDKTPVVFTNLSKGSNSQIWNFSDGPVSTVFSPEHTFAQGTYPITLLAYSAGSCSDTAKRTMTVTGTPSLKVSITSCANKKAQLHAATGTGNYINWWPAAGLSAVNSYDPVAMPAGSVWYHAKVTNITGGCSKTDSILIIRPLATIFPTDTSLFVGESIQISVTDTSNIKSYHWTPETFLSCTACLNPIAKPTESTQYYLIVQEPSGCFTDSLRVSIFLKFGDPNFVGPTAFKPGDEKNGIFKLRSQAYMELIEFQIFNRWGNPVFSSTQGMVQVSADEGGGYSSAEGWDGKYQGKDQPIDTYIWVATGRMFSKEGSMMVKKKGTVILLR